MAQQFILPDQQREAEMALTRAGSSPTQRFSVFIEPVGPDPVDTALTPPVDDTPPVEAEVASGDPEGVSSETTEPADDSDDDVPGTDEEPEPAF